MKSYYEYVIDDIMSLIRDNLILLYNYNEEALINIRKYCNEHSHKSYKPIDYYTLNYFTDEALAEIINCDFLYDFRDIE